MKIQDALNRGIGQFIDNLIDQTKTQQVMWDYLCSNEKLCLNSGLCISDGCFKFNEKSSCFCEINEVYIILLVLGNNPSEMYVVTHKLKCIAHIYPYEYGDRITRLLNMAHHNIVT